MKKLLALLMACATMTCAFASCGDDEAEISSTSSESSVSESSEEETEATTEEETTEEETTEEETTETESDDFDIDDEETEEVEKTTYEFIEDADMTAFLGKWEAEKLVVDGEEMTDLMGLPLYAVCQLEVKEDGTAVMGEPLNEMSDAEVAVTYKWGVVSDTEMAIIIEDGNSILFTLDGDYLIGTEEGDEGQIYCRHVEEFTPFDFESFMAEFQEGLENIEIVTDFEYGDSESDLSDTVIDSNSAETSETASTDLAE